MNIRCAVVFSALFTVPLMARQKTDVIVMKNGDHFTCEIKTLNEGILYAGLDYVDGTISINWAQVARVESNQRFFVHTQDGSLYRGTLRTAATPGEAPAKIEIEETPERQEVVAQRQIVNMAQASESFWRRFSGSVDSGMTYSKGNDTGQYNLSSAVNYRRQRWSADATYSSNLSSSNHEKASTRNQLNLETLRLMRWNNWFYAGLASFLQSSQQGIHRQSSLGGGVGRLFKNTDRSRVSLLAGLTWQDTHYVSSTDPSQKAAAGLIAANAQLFVFKKTSLAWNASLLPVLNQAGRVRFNTNASYSIQIVKDLWWRFTFYGNWDNKPPANLSGSDFGSSSGISYTFN